MRSNQTITSKAVILAGLLILCLFTASNAFTYDYQVTEIQPPVGYASSRAMGINNLGEVVGRFFNLDPSTGEAINRQAFVWDPTNGAALLQTLSGESSAWDINDNGLVSGYSYNAGGKQRAVLWDLEEGTLDDIGGLRNPTTGAYGESSTGYNLNKLNRLVGSADIPNADGSFVPFHAFLYDNTDGIRDLGTFTTNRPEWQNGYSIAYDINSTGEIVGIAHDDSWAFLPFIYDETNGMKALQRDSVYLTSEWYAVTINDTGLIGGHVIAATNQSFPYYWPNRSAAPIKISMPAGFPYGEIYGMNASGQMVGIMWNSDQAGATEHAFMFDTQLGVRDLNNLIDPASGWVLHFAREINENGQIVGYGELAGKKRGFVLGLVCDLSVVWNQSPQPAVAGGLIRYTATLANAGPGNASNVILAGTVPDEVVNLVYSLNGGSWQSFAGAIDVGEIVAGGFSEVVIEGSVAPWVSDPFVLPLSVSTSTTDINVVNNAAEVETLVTSEADLFLSMGYVPKGVGIGRVLWSSAVVRNEGPSDARDVVLRLEGSDWMDSLQYSVDGGANWMDLVGSAHLGTVGANESVEVIVKGLVMGIPETAVECTFILESGTLDPNSGDNSVQIEVTLKESKPFKPLPWLMLLLEDEDE